MVGMVGGIRVHREVYRRLYGNAMGVGPLVDGLLMIEWRLDWRVYTLVPHMTLLRSKNLAVTIPEGSHTRNLGGDNTLLLIRAIFAMPQSFNKVRIVSISAR